MSDTSPLLKEYERLRDHTNAQKRGYDLQGLIGRMLGGYHFKVERKPRVASPRQVDLFAGRGDSVYLIETKWRQDKANIDDIASLYDRLSAVPAHVTGLLVSHAGFTDHVLDRVRENSSRPVVLITGNELEQILRWDGDFLGLLRRKANALLVHREVLVDVEVRRSRPRRSAAANASDLPPAERIFAWPDGTRRQWLQCEGSFGRFTFVSELQDIDWVAGGGFGVTLDLVLPVQEQKDFVDLLHEMARMGWVTPKGCWSIQQATAVWHGFGAGALVEALRDWKSRYQGLETHHTEELCYADECEDGLYTMVAQLSADSRRVVWRVELSFQLRGIPLDTGPYRELCTHFNLSDPVYFRPRSEKFRINGRPSGTYPVVEAVAYVVDLEKLVPGDDDDGDGDEWVCGIVVENPFWNGRHGDRRRSNWAPDMVADSEFLVCALRSWHPLDKSKSVYRLWNFESAWTSDALVVRALADWDDEPDDGVPSIALVVDEEPKPATHPRRKTRTS